MAIAQVLNFNQLAALFLAEAIRSRRTSLARAAEIAQRMISKLPGLNSENQILSILTEIEKEFEEVSALKQALHFGYHSSNVKVYETEIKDYASKILSQNLNSSAIFLQDAASSGMTIERLCLKYPKFCDYLSRNSEKAQLLDMH